MYPLTSYIIYAAPRSGSYLLCEALGNTNLAGRPAEYFTRQQIVQYADHWGVSLLDSASYLRQVYVAGSTPNRVFSTKIIWPFFRDCLDLLRDIEGNEKLSVPELLSTVFPQHQAIMITRRDKVRQAISYWKALQTNQWTLYGDETSVQLRERAVTQELTFDFRSIENLRQYIIDWEGEMQEYFASHHMRPFTVVYEDFVHTYEETALQILDYLHIPRQKDLVFGERKLKKQSNEQTEEWIRQYYHMKQERA